MKITGWHIDGYGIFNDYGVRDLDAGLNVFLGPNEAGKSTLLAFLQGMLFGFLDRRSRVNQYPPLRGGAHGGRLFIRQNGDELTVARSAERRSDIRIQRNGDALDESALHALLGGADRGLFCSVFSFDLTELQDFDRLGKEGIKERIFSAGIVGAGRSANEIAARLLGEAQEIYKYRGSVQELPGLRSRKEELERQFREARHALDAYEQIRGEEDDTATQIAELRARKQKLETDRTRLRLTIDLWPTWHGVESARADLAALPQIDEFPSAPEERLARLAGEAKSAEDQMREVQVELEALGEKRGRLSDALDDSMLASEAEIRAMYEGRGTHRDRMEQLAAKRKEVDVESASISRKISDLGSGWTVDAVAAFDTSLARRQEIESWKDRLAAARAAVDRARSDLHFEQKRHDDAEAEKNRLAENLESMQAPDAEDLRRRRSALVDLRGVAAERAAASVRYDAFAEALGDMEKRLGEIKRQVGSAPSTTSVRALLIGTGAAVALAVVSLIAGFTVVAIVLFVLAAVMGMLLLWSEVRSRAAASLRAESLRLEEQINRRREEIAEVSRTLAGLDDRAARSTAVLGLSGIPPYSQLEQIAATLDDERQALDRYASEKQRHAEASQRSESLQKSLEDAKKDFDESDEIYRALMDDWSRWTAESGFRSNVTPDHAAEFIGEIKAIQEMIERVSKMRADCSDLRERIDRWETDAVSLLRRTGSVEDDETPEGAELLEKVSALNAAAEGDRRRRTELEAVEGSISKNEKKRASLQEQRAEAQEELAKLFSEAGAEDEESFRRRLQVYERRRKLAEDISRGEAEIDRLLGRGDARPAVFENFRRANVEDWGPAAADVERELAALEDERDRVTRRHENLKRERESLEASADAASIATELAGVEAEIREAVRRWCVYTLAGTLVRDTLADFMKTRQPDVLREASQYFKTVTHGAYEHVRMTEDGTGLRVESASGVVREPEHLSRGTAEQLYLCLRFGLAAEYARKQVALPLVMDDVLVNFDPERAAEVAEVIAEVSRRHQVLFFTCHPSTAELLQEAAPASKLIRMPRHGNQV